MKKLIATSALRICVGGMKAVVKKGDELPGLATPQQIAALQRQGLLTEEADKKKGSGNDTE